jgi:serine/threonine protein kinase
VDHEKLSLNSRLQVKKIEDRFDIVKVLGKGTAGTVYHVRDKFKNNKDYALKILSNRLAYDKTTLGRFIEELRICSNIKHKNIVQAYELIETEQCIGYTMELINGCDLRHLLESSKFTYAEVDQIMFQLLEGLAELHRLKIMHRDIKLENIVLSENGELKISDLGLVQKLENKYGANSGVLLGTPQYMAPEYVKSTWFDERSDIYSCGIVLFELLTGRRRLPNKSGIDSIKHLVSTNFELPKISIPRDHSKYFDILKFSLALSPDSRFQTAKQMQQAFIRAEPDIKTEISEKIKKSKIKRKSKAALYFIMLVIMLLMEMLRNLP